MSEFLIDLNYPGTGNLTKACGLTYNFKEGKQVAVSCPCSKCCLSGLVSWKLSILTVRPETEKF